MAIIQEHTITLSKNFGNQHIELIPMTDSHLPILYEWNQRSDVIYWSDTDDVLEHTPSSVDGIYGSISEKAFMFIITLDKKLIGDCWLQDMNLDELTDKHPGKSVKRIDVGISESSFWNKGIGSFINSMLLEFAFMQYNVDLVYAITNDFNLRAQKCLIKSGFEFDETLEHDETSKGKAEFCYLINKETYMRRYKNGDFI